MILFLLDLTLALVWRDAMDLVSSAPRLAALGVRAHGRVVMPGGAGATPPASTVCQRVRQPTRRGQVAGVLHRDLCEAAVPPDVFWNSWYVYFLSFPSRQKLRNFYLFLNFKLITQIPPSYLENAVPRIAQIRGPMREQPQALETSLPHARWRRRQAVRAGARAYAAS